MNIARRRTVCAVIDMNADDKVEFLSDRQTEKGPSTGRIYSIQRLGKGDTTITISHSDGLETFKANDLKLERLVIFPSGAPLWILP